MDFSKQIYGTYEQLVEKTKRRYRETLNAIKIYTHNRGGDFLTYSFPDTINVDNPMTYVPKMSDFAGYLLYKEPLGNHMSDLNKIHSYEDAYRTSTIYASEVPVNALAYDANGNLTCGFPDDRGITKNIEKIPYTLSPNYTFTYDYLLVYTENINSEAELYKNYNTPRMISTPLADFIFLPARYTTNDDTKDEICSFMYKNSNIYGTYDTQYLVMNQDLLFVENPNYDVKNYDSKNYRTWKYVPYVMDEETATEISFFPHDAISIGDFTIICGGGNNKGFLINRWNSDITIGISADNILQTKNAFILVEKTVDGLGDNGWERLVPYKYGNTFGFLAFSAEGKCIKAIISNTDFTKFNITFKEIDFNAQSDITNVNSIIYAMSKDRNVILRNGVSETNNSIVIHGNFISNDKMPNYSYAMLPMTTKSMVGLVYYKDKFYAFASDGSRYSSINGRDWFNMPSISNLMEGFSGTILTTAFGHDILVVVDSDNNVYAISGIDDDTRGAKIFTYTPNPSHRTSPPYQYITPGIKDVIYSEHLDNFQVLILDDTVGVFEDFSSSDYYYRIYSFGIVEYTKPIGNEMQYNPYADPYLSTIPQEFLDYGGAASRIQTNVGTPARFNDNKLNFFGNQYDTHYYLYDDNAKKLPLGAYQDRFIFCPYEYYHNMSDYILTANWNMNGDGNGFTVCIFNEYTNVIYQVLISKELKPILAPAEGNSMYYGNESDRVKMKGYLDKYVHLLPNNLIAILNPSQMYQDYQDTNEFRIKINIYSMTGYDPVSVIEFDAKNEINFMNILYNGFSMYLNSDGEIVFYLNYTNMDGIVIGHGRVVETLKDSNLMITLDTNPDLAYGPYGQFTAYNRYSEVRGSKVSGIQIDDPLNSDSNTYESVSHIILNRKYDNNPAHSGNFKIDTAVSLFGGQIANYLSGEIIPNMYMTILNRDSAVENKKDYSAITLYMKDKPSMNILEADASEYISRNNYPNADRIAGKISQLNTADVSLYDKIKTEVAYMKESPDKVYPDSIIQSGVYQYSGDASNVDSIIGDKVGFVNVIPVNYGHDADIIDIRSNTEYSSSGILPNGKILLGTGMMGTYCISIYYDKTSKLLGFRRVPKGSMSSGGVNTNLDEIAYIKTPVEVLNIGNDLAFIAVTCSDKTPTVDSTYQIVIYRISFSNFSYTKTVLVDSTKLAVTGKSLVSLRMKFFVSKALDPDTHFKTANDTYFFTYAAYYIDGSISGDEENSNETVDDYMYSADLVTWTSIGASVPSNKNIKYSEVTSITTVSHDVQIDDSPDTPFARYNSLYAWYPSIDGAMSKLITSVDGINWGNVNIADTMLSQEIEELPYQTHVFSAGNKLLLLYTENYEFDSITTKAVPTILVIEENMKDFQKIRPMGINDIDGYIKIPSSNLDSAFRDIDYHEDTKMLIFTLYLEINNPWHFEYRYCKVDLNSIPETFVLNDNHIFTTSRLYDNKNNTKRVSHKTIFLGNDIYDLEKLNSHERFYRLSTNPSLNSGVDMKSETPYDIEKPYMWYLLENPDDEERRYYQADYSDYFFKVDDELVTKSGYKVKKNNYYLGSGSDMGGGTAYGMTLIIPYALTDLTTDRDFSKVMTYTAGEGTKRTTPNSSGAAFYRATGNYNYRILKDQSYKFPVFVSTYGQGGYGLKDTYIAWNELKEEFLPATGDSVGWKVTTHTNDMDFTDAWKNTIWHPLRIDGGFLLWSSNKLDYLFTIDFEHFVWIQNNDYNASPEFVVGTIGYGLDMSGYGDIIVGFAATYIEYNKTQPVEFAQKFASVSWESIRTTYNQLVADDTQINTMPLNFVIHDFDSSLFEVKGTNEKLPIKNIYYIDSHLVLEHGVTNIEYNTLREIPGYYYTDNKYNMIMASWLENSSLNQWRYIHRKNISMSSSTTSTFVQMNDMARRYVVDAKMNDDKKSYTLRWGLLDQDDTISENTMIVPIIHDELGRSYVEGLNIAGKQPMFEYLNNSSFKSYGFSFNTYIRGVYSKESIGATNSTDAGRLYQTVDVLLQMKPTTSNSDCYLYHIDTFRITPDGKAIKL